MIEHFLWNDWAVWAVCSLVGALAAAWADHRRRHRRNLDNAGFMPWTAITLLCALIGFFLVSLTVKTW